MRIILKWLQSKAPFVVNQSHPQVKSAKMEHTPGPWQVIERDSVLSITTDRWAIQIANIRNNQDTSTQRMSNAKLIAAAPDLFYTLDRLRRAHDVDGIELTEALIQADNLISRLLK